jgi:hypothetical protein
MSCDESTLDGGGVMKPNIPLTCTLPDLAPGASETARLAVMPVGVGLAIMQVSSNYTRDTLTTTITQATL